MFKWVMPASCRIATATTQLATATATRTAAAAATATATTTRGTTTITKRQLLSTALTTLIIIGALFVQTTSGFRSSIESNGGGRKLFGGYRITPKHCRATKTLPSSDPRSNGPTICMFNHECAQRGGEVVGACMDGFLFGACCQIPQTHELASTLINDAQNAYFQQHQQQQQQQKLQQAAQSSYESYGEQQQQQQQQQQKPQQQQYDQQQQHKPQQQPQQQYGQQEEQQQPQQQYDQQPQQQYDQQPQQPQQQYDQQQQEQQKPQQLPQQQYDQEQSQQQYDQHQDEPQQLSDEQPAQNIYDQQNLDKVYQQLGSTTSIGQSVQPVAEDEVSFSSGSTEATNSQSASVEFEQDAELQVNNDAANFNEVKVTEQPPAIHVNKHSVKINTFSSPPGNDDFVMQVLATLPPEHTDDIVTFTTEVPTKISGSTLDHSSESNSFEETPATKAPATTAAPTTPKAKPQTKPQPKPQPKPQQKPQPKPQAKPTVPAKLVPQLAETMKRPVQQIKAKPKPTQQSNMHHHNHLLLDGGEFTHSDITHPGADADLVEDLQFSTGYGPQPVYVQPPQQQQQQQPSSQSYTSSSSSSSSSSTQPTAATEDKYVLVPTYNNEKRPSPAAIQSNPTTVSSITTHVDSIESIILQLSNSSHGPSYNVVSQQTPSYGYAPQADHSETTAAVTAQPDTGYYQQPQEQHNEGVKSPEPEQDYGYTTSANYETSYDKVSDEQDVSATGSQSAELPTPRPTYSEDQSSVLEEHTMPATGYNDAAIPSGPQTSEFNKMPVMGIAYPVDMAYLESESGQAELSGYGQLSSGSQEANTEVSYQKITNTYTEAPQPSPAYVRPSTAANRPVASYIGMVTMQHYNDPLPAEVSVSSHTTKVQEQYDASSDGYQQTEKLSIASPAPTSSYIASTTTTQAQRPQYDAVDSSSSRPVLITASPKPRPKPSSKRPPTKKTPLAQPSNSYNQPQFSEQNTRRPAYDTDESPVTHIHIKQPLGNYNTEQVTQQADTGYPQSQSPAANYDQPAAAPTVSYDQASSPAASYDQSASPALDYAQPTNSYDQPAPAPAPVPAPAPAAEKLGYNEQSGASSPTRKPVSSKPIATSYVTGPTTPRPPATVDYHYDKVPPLFMADDKLDAFIQSTAENILGSTPGNYQAPLYATASTPIHIQHPTSNYGGHKKPGFVQITPKPTAINLVSSTPWIQNDNSNKVAATTNSYIYGPSVTRRPATTPAVVSSNDFEDPGYFGMPSAGVGSSPVHLTYTQSTTETLYGVPSDDKPAFPGYYGPTPTYPAFSVPGEKIGQQVNEETYTSPNDFVNFPPVRNPNLNMSAASSAVTSDLELSTPAFVEDVVLKDKMHTLVHKLVASLQGNFEALADMIDETNNTASTYAAGPVGGASTNLNRKTTRKPVRVATTAKPKATTKKPVTRVTTKAPNKKTSATTTRKPVTRRTTTPTTTTRRPSSKKPTKRISSTVKTTARPANDEIVDEEDEEDVNPSPHENEIDQGSTLSSYGGANGRKIQCGVRPHVKSGRIVGGKGSTFGAFPWQVLVRESTWLGLFTKNKCGGVLITSRYVITAAHCQPGFLASLVAVMGEFDISGDLESKRPITKNVKRVIVHRQYDPATFENDLALLEMDSPVTFDTHIVPICMPNDLADFTGRMATVTGWGRLKYGGGVPSVLQEVQVPIIENSVCQEMFHTAGHNKKILGSFLCAGYANGQKDSCEGDSGGPLVLQRPDGRYELAGTVSHGIKCAAPYLPGVYMRTTFYKPWLRSITGVK